MDGRDVTMPQRDLVEILRRVDLLAAESGYDQAEATRIAAVTICHIRPDWPMHEALKFVWRHRS